jgi:predicted Rossmann fold nucleotide-binding protein DprA/Smf involved in DNA uptake
LGDIIFLPEAGIASGSLITVDRGLEYGKKIYAPMQDIFSEYGR